MNRGNRCPEKFFLINQIASYGLQLFGLSLSQRSPPRGGEALWPADEVARRGLAPYEQDEACNLRPVMSPMDAELVGT